MGYYFQGQIHLNRLQITKHYISTDLFSDVMCVVFNIAFQDNYFAEIISLVFRIKKKQNIIQNLQEQVNLKA